MLTFIFFRSLAQRLCYFTIYDPSIHDPTMPDSGKKYLKMLQLCRENYVNTYPRHHMESDSVFIEWLASFSVQQLFFYKP